MRITNKNIVNNYMYGMQKNLQNMQKLNTEMNTQKVINKVSDDPYNATKIMQMKTEIADIEKFNYNCDEIQGWVDTTDDALNKVGSITSEIRTLLNSINDTYTQGEVDAIKKDIKEKVKELGESLNATYAGKYIFGGSILDEKPINVIEEADGSVRIEINPNINNEDLKAEISNGMSIDYNLSLNEVFGADGLNILNDMLTTLDKEPFDVNEIIQVKDNLDNFMQNVLDCRSTIGSKSKAVESIKNNNISNLENVTITMSQIQDADFAEKFIELKTAELAYNASVQVGTKLFQSTILDFIR